MKKINIAYWIVTILFAGFMIFSSVDGIMMNERSVQFMEGMLHFPKYMIPFISWAKILGVIAILVPGFPRIKEWAYAGLFFDLAGATYATYSVMPDPGGFFFMALIIGFLFASYFLYHKRMKMKGQATV
jgi:uncharacterized membrane protein YphA (DoxX/SURF4 family)